MNVEIATNAGFCFGVKKAISKAYEQKNQTDDTPVYTFGPLVHNPQVVSNLEKDRIISIDQLEKHKPGFLIIRSHGVPPEIKNKANKLGYTVIDATCPLVQRIHDIVIQLKKEGYKIFIIGDAEHPEIIGILGEVADIGRVIETEKQAEELPSFNKIGIVVQTTALWSKFESISCKLIDKGKEIRIFNTICNATTERQTSARILAEKVDVMVILGGKSSSNTRKLYEICKSVNSNTFHVETGEEIKNEWLKDARKVGITAGASTPDYIIQETYERLKKL